MPTDPTKTSAGGTLNEEVARELASTVKAFIYRFTDFNKHDKKDQHAARPLTDLINDTKTDEKVKSIIQFWYTEKKAKEKEKEKEKETLNSEIIDKKDQEQQAFLEQIILRHLERSFLEPQTLEKSTSDEINETAKAFMEYLQTIHRLSRDQRFSQITKSANPNPIYVPGFTYEEASISSIAAAANCTQQSLGTPPGEGKGLWSLDKRSFKIMMLQDESNMRAIMNDENYGLGTKIRINWDDIQRLNYTKDPYSKFTYSRKVLRVGLVKLSNQYPIIKLNTHEYINDPDTLNAYKGSYVQKDGKCYFIAESKETKDGNEINKVPVAIEIGKVTYPFESVDDFNTFQQQAMLGILKHALSTKQIRVYKSKDNQPSVLKIGDHEFNLPPNYFNLHSNNPYHTDSEKLTELDKSLIEQEVTSEQILKLLEFIQKNVTDGSNNSGELIEILPGLVYDGRPNISPKKRFFVVGTANFAKYDDDAFTAPLKIFGSDDGGVLGRHLARLGIKWSMKQYVDDAAFLSMALNRSTDLRLATKQKEALTGKVIIEGNQGKKVDDPENILATKKPEEPKITIKGKGQDRKDNVVLKIKFESDVLENTKTNTTNSN